MFGTDYILAIEATGSETLPTFFFYLTFQNVVPEHADSSHTLKNGGHPARFLVVTTKN